MEDKTKYEVTTNESQPQAMLEIVAKAAAAPDVDEDKMSKLLDVQERMLDKQAEINFNQALARVQEDMPRIVKTGKIIIRKEVQSTYGKYEDLDRAVRPVLVDQGLSLRYNSRQDDGVLVIHGTLSHRDGHSESAEIPLPIDTSGNKNGVQSIGSTVSYGKRYLACMLLNIVFEDEDDDGMGADDATITKDQAAKIEKLMDGLEIDRDKFLRYVDAESVGTITLANFDKAVKALKSKAKQQEGGGK